MDPIKTIIKNNTAASKTIHWAGKDTKWLPAHGETTVPFELWSVATDAQRAAIKTAVASGAVELSLRVLGDKGEYMIVPFNPCGAAVRPVTSQKIVELDTTKQQIAELDHTVRVVSTDTANVMGAYGAKPLPVGTDDIIPVRELKNGVPEAPAAEEEQVAETAVEEQPTETKKRRAKKAE